MANTIDQLNFEVIVSDKKFDAQIKDIENKAKQFNTSLSNILNIRKVSTQMSQKDVENARRVWQAKVDEQRAQEKINREKIKSEGLQRKINAQIDRATKGYNQQSRILNELKGYALGYLSIHGASQLLSSLVRVTGEFELQKTTLSAMLGDLNTAEGIITRIQGLAVESPFQFKELTTYAKQLSAFSVPAQELYDTTKMLADISAGLGVGMDRIVLAYGQVRSAAFLRGQEVRQFTEAGIPILDELAKQFSELEGRAVSAGEVFDKISARLVPFEMVAKVFKDMTSEGGKFYNMQEIQAETLRGKISNLKDAYEVMLNEIGKGQSENLKGAVDWARKLMTNYEETGRTLVELVAAYGVYRATLAITTNLQSTLARNLVVLRQGFASLSSMLSVNPYAILAAGITAVGLGIYKTVTHLKDYERIQKSVSDTQEEFSRNISLESSKLDALYAKLRVAKEGTEDYAEAKKQIYTQYASYIAELKNEGIAVDNLASLYDNLKDKIIESAKAKYRMTAAQGVEEEYARGIDALYKRFELLSKNMGNTIKRELMEVEKEALWQYLLGDENALNIPEAEGIRGKATDMGTGGYGYLVERAKGDAKLLIDTYTKAKERIDNLFGEESSITETESPFVYPEESPKGKSPAEKVQDEIDAVQRLRDAYETLAPYMNGEMLKKTLTALFPNADQELIQSLNFRAKLVELAAELNEFDQNAAQRLLDSISGEKAGEIVSAFNAVETYKNMLDSWLGEDFNLTGEGVAFDISKIVRDLNNQYAKINQKAIQASDLLTKAQMGDEEALKTVREIYGEEVWQQYLVNGKNVINRLAEAEREEAKKTAQEKINDLASSYVNQKIDGLDLSDWGDKTINQIEGIRQRLLSLKNEDIQLPESTIQSLEALGLSTDALSEKIREIFAGKLEDVTVEKFKALADVVKDVTSVTDSLGDQLLELGDTMESDFLKGFGKSLKSLSELTDILAECDSLMQTFADSGMESSENIAEVVEETEELADAEQGAAEGMEEIAKSSDWITMVIKLAVSLISKVVDGINESQQAIHDARMAAIEYVNTLNQIEFDNLMSSFDSAFGTDSQSKFIAAMEKAIEYQNGMIENQRKIAVTERDLADLIMDSSGWANFSKGLKDAWKEIKDLGQGDILVDMRTGWQKFWATGNDLIKSFSINDYLTDDGFIDGEKLRNLYDQYGEYMSESNQAAIEEILGQYDLYVDAITEVSNYMSSMFGSVADSMAESFVESFKESGKAALEYGDIMDEVATSIAKSIVQSMIVRNVFDDTKAEEVAKQLASGNTAGAMATIEQAMQAAQELAPYIQEFLESMQPYFQMDTEEGATNLGEGIKGVTEDTANLLASYLNAIRADVSYSKSIWERMDVTTRQIAAALVGFSAPSLMEYQAQIAANTMNTALTSQSILSELRSVLDYSGTRRCIRVS